MNDEIDGDLTLVPTLPYNLKDEYYLENDPIAGDPPSLFTRWLAAYFPYLLLIVITAIVLVMIVLIVMTGHVIMVVFALAAAIVGRFTGFLL